MLVTSTFTVNDLFCKTAQMQNAKTGRTKSVDDGLGWNNLDF